MLVAFRRAVVAVVLVGACVARAAGDGSGATAGSTEGTSVGVTSAEVTTGAVQTGASASGTSGSTGAAETSAAQCVVEPGIEFECDPWCQDCPRGQKCIAWGQSSTWDSTKCAEVAEDPRQPGESCTVEGSGLTGLDDCDVGAMCWDIDPQTNMGTCLALCTGTPEAPSCAAGTMCAVFNGGVLNLCFSLCDPLAQDCPEGNGCFPWDPSCEGGVACLPAGPSTGFICIPDASGELPVFQPCEHTNTCSPGSFCAPADAVPGCGGAVGCCSAFCSLDAAAPNADCIDGQVCVPYFALGAAPPGYENVGACSTP